MQGPGEELCTVWGMRNPDGECTRTPGCRCAALTTHKPLSSSKEEATRGTHRQHGCDTRQCIGSTGSVPCIPECNKVGTTGSPQQATSIPKLLQVNPGACINFLSTRQPHGGMVGPLVERPPSRHRCKAWAAEMGNLPLQQHQHSKKTSISKGFKLCTSERDNTRDKTYNLGKQNNDMPHWGNPQTAACQTSQHTST